MPKTVFEFVAGALQEHTAFDKLQARGTLRIALKAAGLDARSVTPEQMAVVIERAMAPELEARGIEEARSVCDALLAGMKNFSPEGEDPAPESPEDVFRRLGGR